MRESIGAVRGPFSPGGAWAGAMIILLSIVCSVSVILISTTDLWFLPPAIILAVAYLFWSFSRPAVAVVTIIFLYLHIIEESEDITPIEIGFGAYLFGFVLYWFARRFFFAKEPIVEDITDRFLLAFYGVGFLSVCLVLARGDSLSMWFRELLTFSYVLLFFPAREAMSDERGLRHILIGFGVMAGIVAVNNIWEYKEAVGLATYMWELIRGRTPFGAHFFFPIVVVGVGLLGGARQRLGKIVAMFLTLFFGFALLLTFTRGFWAGTAFAVLMLLILLEKRSRHRIIAISAAILVAITGLIYLLGGGYVIEALVIRFASFGGALRDISIAGRLAESKAVIELILESPLIGYGVGAVFTHYNLLIKSSVESLYVHNGYLYLMFKTGLIGTLIFFGFYFGVLLKGIRVSRTIGDDVSGVITKSATAILFAMAFVTVTSNAYRDKESLLVLVLASACIMARWKLVRPHSTLKRGIALTSPPVHEQQSPNP